MEDIFLSLSHTLFNFHISVHGSKSVLTLSTLISASWGAAGRGKRGHDQRLRTQPLGGCVPNSFSKHTGAVIISVRTKTNVYSVCTAAATHREKKKNSSEKSNVSVCFLNWSSSSNAESHPCKSLSGEALWIMHYWESAQSHVSSLHSPLQHPCPLMLLI